MLKKKLAVATIIVAALASTCNAASFTSWDKAIMPKSHAQVYHYFYIKSGIGAYNFNASKLGALNPSKSTTIFNLAAGYAFYNARTNWITRIFGHDNAVELQLDYLNTAKNKSNPNGLGNGFIWFIDGSGALIPFAEPMRDLSLKAKSRYINAGLYYHGSWRLGNPRVTFMPRIGGIITNLNQEYNYTVHFSTGAIPPNFRTDIENYKINTYYYGIAVGSRLGYQVRSRLTVFGDLEAQLLYACSKLHAYQNAFAEYTHGDDYIKHAKRIGHHLTYRAILSVGGQYKINNKVNSPSIEAKVGLDRWGYTPRLITPSTSNNGRSVYLSRGQNNNGFVKLTITYPIG